MGRDGSLRLAVPALLCGALFCGCAVAPPRTGITEAPPAPQSQPVRVEPQQRPEGLQPGLAVLYFYDFFERHIKGLPTGLSARRRGRPGKPVMQINHRFGTGEVFDSGRAQGIGVQMSGFIHFSKPGRYELKAYSNDGVRVFVGETMILEDGDVHSDRFSAPGIVEVAAPGYCPLVLQYFQRKGTATLEMHWRPPGAESFSVIPDDAYAHVPAK